MASQNSRSTFSAICISNGLVWVRTRATVGPRNCVDYSRASAPFTNPLPAMFPFGGVIRAFSSRWCGRLAGKLERGGPIGARFPAFVTSYEGPCAGFLNFCRRFGSGKPSFLRISFVDHCSEATNSITRRFQFSPVPLCAVAHVSNMHRGASEYAEINAGKVRNVVR